MKPQNLPHREPRWPGPSDLSEFLAVTKARREKGAEDALAHMGAWKQRAGPKTRAPAPTG